jgi:hypothetical protein
MLTACMLEQLVARRVSLGNVCLVTAPGPVCAMEKATQALACVLAWLKYRLQERDWGLSSCIVIGVEVVALHWKQRTVQIWCIHMVSRSFPKEQLHICIHKGCMALCCPCAC